MYRMVRSGSVKMLLAFEIPAIVFAIAIAEMFYKFGSFTLECLAFLPTWYTLSFLFDRLGGWARRYAARS